MWTMTIRSVAAAALVALALFAAGCAGGEGAGAGAAKAAAADTAVIGQKAPEFALADLEGRTVRLSDTAGRVRIVDFWATWCAPCREEVPMLKDLYAQYKDRGVELIAVSLDDDADAVRAFVREHDIPYPNLMADAAVQAAYRPVGVPATFIIDRDGTLVESMVGAKPRRALEEEITRLLAAAPAAGA